MYCLNKKQIEVLKEALNEELQNTSEKNYPEEYKLISGLVGIFEPAKSVSVWE